ncbi:heme NO-binding protein [Rhodosalinus sediminis]|uniref:Heme NO-binding protein n=1 Tax=Rhodosalinus sediminis TaxID=1940533 RepID=A0A3D9BMP8_9RHOB|nr:heme NO-binding domain-containing protein [Rhodosalinus sediminis]REC54784.1 heme NO-binding protein [Rhodosalinus sediminis]
MHGLINRAIQGFVADTYGRARWIAVTHLADLGFADFEAMMIYPPELTQRVLDAAVRELGKARDELLEDIGIYLASHPQAEAVRRLLRFGGVTFVDFLHSLDDLPERARLAVSDLALPALELSEHAPGRYTLTVSGEHDGFGPMLLGVLRAMADDYGALVYTELRRAGPGSDALEITLVESAYAEGRRFVLGGSD